MTIQEEKRAGYISLKDASERFGYSQDYLGQLIRKGKIEGKLVYSHVAWVTTPEAIEEYIAHSKDRKRKKKDEIADIPPHAETPAIVFSPTSAVDGEDVAHEQVTSFVAREAQEDEQSRLGKWLIILFRALVFAVLIVAVFVFYLLTTAFGEEVRGGELLSASTTFSLSANGDHHE